MRYRSPPGNPKPGWNYGSRPRCCQSNHRLRSQKTPPSKPPFPQAVDDEVTGHLRGGEIQVQLLGLGQEQTEGRQPPPRLEVMIGPGGPEPALPATGERADEHGGLGIRG